MSPNTTGSHPSASKRTSYASNVLRFLITNMTLFGLGLGCSMIQSGTDTLRSNRSTCLCSESEESRMASSCSENSERRLSNLSVSVFPLFVALLPVMTQPATDTPIVTAHPAMVTHNPSIDSSPIWSEWRLVLAVLLVTSVGEPSGGPLVRSLIGSNLDAPTGDKVRVLTYLVRVGRQAVGFGGKHVGFLADAEGLLRDLVGVMRLDEGGAPGDAADGGERKTDDVGPIHRTDSSHEGGA